MTAKVSTLPNRRVTLMANTVLAAAVANVEGTAIEGLAGARYLALEAKFARDGGGTTCKVWVQTSLDGGTTWFDIACFAFTTSTANKLHVVRMDPATPMTAASVPASATLTDDTVLQIIGDRIRTLHTTTGTYTGASSVEVHAVIKG